jgi:hypothetical protein
MKEAIPPEIAFQSLACLKSSGSHMGSSMFVPLKSAIWKLFLKNLDPARTASRSIAFLKSVMVIMVSER